MKFSLAIFFFFAILIGNLLLGQNIHLNNNLGDHYRFIQKLNNQPKSNKQITKYEIQFDSIHFSNKSKIRLRYFYKFDNDRNIESDFYNYFREGQFEPTAFFIFKFNQKDLLSEISYSDPWDGNLNVPGANEVNWTRRATYNNDDKVKLYSYYLPLEDGGEFLLNEYDHIYNSEGLLSELHYYSYATGEWTLSNLEYYNYENNLLVEVIDKERDINDNWVTKDSTSYKYFPDDKLKSITQFYSMDLGPNFNVEYLYEYNDLNQLSGEHEYRNSENDEGEPRTTRFLTYHNYDSFGNLILSKNYSSFNVIDSVIGSEEYYTYNLDFTSEETQLPKPNAFSFNEDILNRSPIYPIKTYEKYGYEQGENPGLEDREEYFYSKITTTSTSDTQVPNLQVLVSPNPTQLLIQFHFDNSLSSCDVSILDLTGKRIVDMQGCRSGHDIDVSSLEPGVYFYQVKHKQGSESGQFVKL